MKKAIELLKDGLAYIRGGETADYGSDTPTVLACLNAVKMQIKKTIAELETPRWYTPERWEAETGEPWQDDWPVWRISDEEEPEWRGCSYRKAKKIARVNDTTIICANFDGPLPHTQWEPGEAE
jgi:hypothetical protein